MIRVMSYVVDWVLKANYPSSRKSVSMVPESTMVVFFFSLSRSALRFGARAELGQGVQEPAQDADHLQPRRSLSRRGQRQPQRKDHLAGLRF